MIKNEFLYRHIKDCSNDFCNNNLTEDRQASFNFNNTVTSINFLSLKPVSIDVLSSG